MDQQKLQQTTVSGSDLIAIQQQISKVTERLMVLVDELKPLGREAARTAAEYDKQLAIALIKMKNGQRMDLCGLAVESPPVSIMEKVAKGLCWEYRLKADVAEHDHVNCQRELSVLRAVLSGKQTQNRHFDIDIS